MTAPVEPSRLGSTQRGSSGQGGSSVNAASQRFQEEVYGKGHDYRAESPHLKQRRLYDSLLAVVRGGVEDLERRGLPLTVLEIGAGDGALVQPLLAFGCEVTASEMSRPAIAQLSKLYERNANFRAVFDEDGSLDILGERRFSMIIFSSVLHHIPDYLAAIDHAISNRLAQAGMFLSFQDPLWYPAMPPGVHALSELAFFAWRVGQGNLMRGVRSRLRRLRRAYDEANPSDMVEYHVVRDGVNESDILALISPHFDAVREIEYWSTFAQPWQWLGDRLAIANTFAVTADLYDGMPLS